MTNDSFEVTHIDKKLTDMLPLYYARKYCLLPLNSSGPNVVVLTANGEDDPFVLGSVSDQLNLRLIPYTLRTFSEEAVRKGVEDLYKNKRLRFGELLLANNILSEGQLTEVLHLQRETPYKRIGSIVKELGYAQEHDLQKVYAEQLGYKFLSLEAANFLDLNFISKFPEDVIRAYNVLPLPSEKDYKMLHVLTSEELDKSLIDLIKQEMGVERVEPILTMREDLDQAIDSAFRRLSTIRSQEKSLGRILLEKELLTEEQLDKALEEQRRNNRKLGEVLIDKRILPESVVMEVIAERIDAKYMRQLPAVIDPDLRNTMTQRFALFNKVVPIGREDDKLIVAMTDPADKNLLTTLRTAINKEITPVLAAESQIRIAIQRLYDLGGTDVPSTAENASTKISGGGRIQLHQVADSQSIPSEAQYNTERIINIVNNILVEAVMQGASDVHLTPDEQGLGLYYRVDGSLAKINTFGQKDRDNIIARFKIMSSMRIDTKHIPQGGRIIATIDNNNIDFRASTLPTQHGENVVLRILDSSKMLDSDLSKLGMPEQVVDDFLDECERPQGIVLVTGPTGSGKTTSLYHVLNHLHKTYPHKSISTIENPIEYVIDGIVQSEINEARGLTYAKILKEKLRQDPDTIMVGEIRNLEEGDLAFTAALTGHMVLSTLHTNDGASTIRRLVEMGLEPYNVSTGINCILSQRLARRICLRCVTDYTPIDRELKKVRKSLPDFDPSDYKLKTGAGCDFCNGGYKGRVGIYELLIVNADIKKLISENATDSEIRDAAVSNGMSTLRMAGLDLAFQGITSLTEVLSVTDVMH